MYSIRKGFIKGLLLLLLGLGTAVGQDNTTIYWQPTVAINYDVNNSYSHNFSILNRNYLYNDGNSQLTIRHFDLSHFSDFQISERQHIAIGLLYRFRELFDGQSNELRLTQQYNLQIKPNVVRLGHRLRAEQRITTSNTIHRFRYRFGVDFPLKGEKLDLGEPYFIGTVEHLLSVAKSTRPEYDSRISLFVGWQLSKNAKMQLGSEYRLEDFTNTKENVIFLLSGLLITL